MNLLDRALANRNRLPAFLNRLVDRIADRPMSLVGRIAARRLGAPTGFADVSTVPDAPIRVLVAPVNYSNQGRMWAHSLETNLDGVAARNMAVDVPGGFSFAADLLVPVPDYNNSREWQQAQREAVRAFSHVLVEAEEPLFGRLLGRDALRELSWMLDAGIDVAFMVHGTDARIPAHHATRTPWSPYNDPSVYLSRLETLARRNIDIVAGSGRPVFASTPDLLLDVPTAVWCPVVVEPSRWANARTPASPTGPLRVVHAPSSAVFKGTALIEPMLRRMDAEGVIEYRPVRGVASADMPDVFAHADIVLDQFRLGSYGVGACEAMAAGAVVVGHILDDVRRSVHDLSGHTLPVLEATPDSLEEVIRRLDGDRAIVSTVAGEGVSFVNEVHDGRRSAAVLAENWLVDSPL